MKLLANEIRTELLSVLWKTQKTVNPSLAAIELTLALHYVFRAPVDNILWDAVEQVSLCFEIQGIDDLILLCFLSSCCVNSFWCLL